MSIRKPALPDTPNPGSAPHERFQFDSAVKETLEVITGRRKNTVAELPATATMAEMITKINQLISQLQ